MFFSLVVSFSGMCFVFAVAVAVAVIVAFVVVFFTYFLLQAIISASLAPYAPLLAEFLYTIQT